LSFRKSSSRKSRSSSRKSRSRRSSSSSNTVSSGSDSKGRRHRSKKRSESSGGSKRSMKLKVIHDFFPLLFNHILPNYFPGDIAKKQTWCSNSGNQGNRRKLVTPLKIKIKTLITQMKWPSEYCTQRKASICDTFPRHVKPYIPTYTLNVHYIHYCP
jgi:hypothetical protein